ncbi:MAG: IS3 family transposase [Flavobacteriaceae bacterium]|nr:IS3 family transposase [Flavobacteriaceae bacterium]
MENWTVKQRKEMVQKDHKKLSIRSQCKLLSVTRSSLYYQAKGESKENLQIMRKLDEIYLDNPTYGVLRMQDELWEDNFHVNEKRVRRLMRLMCLEAIYPKKNLSKLGKACYIHPYLLKNLNVARPNQVWQIDISYIAMARGFMYLTVIIDMYSRMVVGWKISNTLDKEAQTELLHECIARYGKPEIVNSDQGSQYTSEHWVETLKEHSVKISMNSKGRALDNICGAVFPHQKMGLHLSEHCK